MILSILFLNKLRFIMDLQLEELIILPSWKVDNFDISFKVDFRLMVNLIEIKLINIMANIEFKVKHIELINIKIEFMVKHIEFKVKHIEIVIKHIELKLMALNFIHIELMATHIELKVRHIELRHIELMVIQDFLKVEHIELKVKHIELKVKRIELEVIHTELMVKRIEQNFMVKYTIKVINISIIILLIKLEVKLAKVK